jgi:uncharacterized protein (TIGR00730 family)
MSFYHNVAVFCGSRSGNKPIYAEQARELGEMLGRRGAHLIYGGGERGLMGEVSRAADAHGASITAVIPHAFVKPATALSAKFNTVTVENLFERKNQMIFKADLAIALPGGIGTHDEDFEVLAFNDLETYHSPQSPMKPLILINIDGHFEGMRMLLEKSVETGFANPQILNAVHWAEDAKSAMEIYDGLRCHPVRPVSCLLPGASMK